MPVPVLSFFAAEAHAAPTFTGDPIDVAQAGRFWPAAVACAGWEPASAPIVAIERVDGLADGLAGLSTIGEHGLESIALDAAAPPVVLAHEVAHAWFSADARALNEGRAELVAECIADALPDDVRFLRIDDYAAADLVDLRTWADDAELTQNQVHAAYSGSWRAFEIVGSIVPRQTVLAKDVTSWDQVLALLDAAGPTGAVLAEAIRGGVDTQRVALADDDGDAIVNVRERILGSDPAKWDTDGDGWWDGAPAERPTGAVPFARDGTPVCLPSVSDASLARPGDPENAQTHVAYEGFARGVDLRAMSLMDDGTSLLWWDQSTSGGGGIYLVPRGDGLAPNPRCASTRDLTVLVKGGVSLAAIPDFVAAVAEARAAFDAALGPTDHRLAVLADAGVKLGLERHPGSDPRVVTVPVDLLNAALASDDKLRALAYNVAALHRLDEADHPNATNGALAAALVAHVTGAKKVPILGVGYRADVKDWQKQVAACGDWARFLEDRCSRHP